MVGHWSRKPALRKDGSSILPPSANLILRARQRLIQGRVSDERETDGFRFRHLQPQTEYLLHPPNSSVEE